MKVNYLRMIWDVKIYLAKIKDGKGKDLNFLNKKTLPTIIRPKSEQPAIFAPLKSSSFFTNLLLY